MTLKENQKQANKQNCEMENEIKCVLSQKQIYLLHNLFTNIDYEIKLDNDNYYMQHVIITTKNNKKVSVSFHIIKDEQEDGYINYLLYADNKELLYRISQAIVYFNEDLNELQALIDDASLKKENEEKLIELLNINSISKLSSIITIYKKISDEISKELTLTELINIL